jgi:hypothetical protein
LTFGGQAADAAELGLLWSTSQDFLGAAAAEITHLVIDGAVLDDGRPVFLGRTREESYALMVGPTADSAWVPVDGQPLGNADLFYILDSDADGVWVGGASLRRGREGLTDTFIAKLALTGEVVWASTFGEERQTTQLINDALALPTGELIVTGSYVYSDSYLAKISADGRELWSVPFGSGQGSAVTLLPDGGLLVGGFVGNGAGRQSADYIDHLAIWVFNENGLLREESVLRESFSDAARVGYGYGEVKLLGAGEEVYVAMVGSARLGGLLPPVEIAKLTPSGRIWHTSLLDTLLDSNTYVVALAEHAPSPDWFARCDPRMALTDTSLLVACRNQGRIDLYKLVRRSGEPSLASLPFPACQNGIAELRLGPLAAETLTVVGIPEKIGGLAAGTEGDCAWAGRVAVSDLQTEISCRNLDPGTRLAFRAFLCLAPELAGFPRRFPTDPVLTPDPASPLRPALPRPQQN